MTTDVYSKPTDKHQYLSPSICHLKHCFKSIPFSQAIRVKRICSTVETTKQRLGDLRHHLKRRGYNDKVIKSGFSKASEINRNDLLEYKEKKINKRVPLVLTYHPSLEKISGIVRHHWKEIEKSETLAKLFPEPPVVAFRRPKSIKDTLVRAAVSRPSSTVGQCKPCGDKRCKCCLQLQHAQVFHSKTTGKEYKIFCNVNCKTPNVVYLLDCHVCGSQYVGESVQPFNKRMNGEVTLRKRRSCPWVNTLCRRGTHWMTLVDPKFISLTTIQVGQRIKDKKERVLDPQVTNITSGGHKQKGLNLLFF